MKKIQIFVIVLLMSLVSVGQTAKIYFDKGYAKFIHLDYRGAIADYNKAIEIKPNYADAYYNRAIAKGELQDDRGAIDDFSKTIEIKPYYAIAYHNRGVSKYNINDINGACIDFSKAGELGFEEAYNTIRDLCN